MKIKYFKGRVSKGFVSIVTARIILRISVGLLGLFLPIFLYNFFDLNIRYVFLFYFLIHLSYALLLAWFCQYLNKIGLRNSIRISVLVGAVYYFLLFLLDSGFRDIVYSFGVNPATWLILAIISTSIFHKALYWVPLNTDMAKFTSKRNRAKELSLLESVTMVLGAVMPLVAGWILSYHNYNILFLIAIIIYIVAIIPLIYLPRTRERFTWSCKRTWQEFFSKKRRGEMLAYMGDGAEKAVGVIIWPIFMFELLEGNYFEVGALSSLIVMVTIALQLIVGGYTDKGGVKKMLRYGTIFYAIGWLIKIFIVTAFQIFIVSMYHNLMKIFAKTPFDALSFEKASDEGHSVDEYTALHEMAVNFGKSSMLVFAFVLVGFLSIEWTFVLAALASLVLNFITLQFHDEAKRKGI